MVIEVLLPCEGLSAEGTPMRRFTRVLPHVIGQVLLASERLGAVGALVWGFPRVLPDVVHCGRRWSLDCLVIWSWKMLPNKN